MRLSATVICSRCDFATMIFRFIKSSVAISVHGMAAKTFKDVSRKR
jgi:hypothetical protein